MYIEALMVVIEWVIVCCLTPSERFFSNIMARTSNIRRDDNNFVLDQHAKLGFYSDSLLKQGVASFRDIILICRQTAFLLTAMCLA